MTVMKQGQTRLSSQYAKRGVSKFTLRTYISFLPYQGADHLTFQADRGGGGGGLITSGQQEYFSSTNLSPSHLSAGFFP